MSGTLTNPGRHGAGANGRRKLKTLTMNVWFERWQASKADRELMGAGGRGGAPTTLATDRSYWRARLQPWVGDLTPSRITR